MTSSNSKNRVIAVMSVFLAFIIGFGGYSLFLNFASGENGVQLSDSKISEVKAAIAADGDVSGGVDADDRGEVQKGDIVSYWLQATYIGFDGETSGIITFTDQLPEHMKLVTGKQTVAGVETDCTPVVVNTAKPAINWADPTKTPTPYDYDESTRTFKAEVANVPASDGTDERNVVKIHIYAEVLDDATTLDVENVYYINYVKITHAGSTTTSNKVQFHSGNPSDQTYTISYRFKDGSPVPPGVTAPTDTTIYSKGADVSIEPNMESQGYSFSGWSLVKDGLADGTYDWSSDNPLSFNLHKGTTGVDKVIFEGEWTAKDKIDITYEWQGKESDLSSNDSADDKPNAGTPEESEIFENLPISLPTYPATDTERQSASYAGSDDSYSDLYDLYNFLGWKVFAADADGVSNAQTLTTAEVVAKEFTPKAASGKKVSSVNIVGYWVKREFTVTFKAEDGQTPDSWTAPTAIKSKWDKVFTVTDPEVDGYRFNGWSMEPDLGSGVETTDGDAKTKQYTMPTSDVVAYASFTKTYSVNVTSGTASTSSVEASSSIRAAAGEIVTLKPLDAMDDVAFKSWTSAVAVDANNWKKENDGTATFVMPASDVSAVANYEMRIDFLVVNGVWDDNISGYKTVKISVAQVADGSWSGSMQESDVPTGMKADSAHLDSSGKWGDGVTAEQLPSTYVGTAKIKADASGKATTPTLFTYTFTDAKPNITITYKVNDTSYGNVKVNRDGAVAASEAAESNINPIGAVDQVKGATAISNVGYTFKNWVRNSDPDIYSLDASFVPEKSFSEGSDIEFFEEATYTANFEPNSYTIKFDGNGATSGTMDDLAMKVGTRTALTTNAFVKDGFKFGGWTTAPNNTGDYYSDGEDVLDLATDEGAVVTLYAKWVDNSGTVVLVDPTDPTAGNLLGHANNIRIPLTQAKELAGKTDNATRDTLTKLSGAYFTFEKADTRTELVDVASVDNNGIEGAVGTYTVTLKSAEKSGKSATVEFTAVVYDGASPDVDGDDAIKIAANDFTVSADEVKTKKLNDESDAGAKAELKRLANAYAWEVLTRDEIEVTGVESKIVADDSGFGVKGIYDVTFSAPSRNGQKSASVTVKATVTDYSDEKADMRITAHDFALQAGEVANTTDDQFIEAANARGVKMADSSALPVSIDRSSEDKTNVKAERGIYVMTFYTESAAGLKDGPEITVKVTVTDNAIIDDDSTHVICANDFSVGVKYVESLTDAQVISLAKAGAYDKVTGAVLPLDVDFSAIEAKRGTYFPVKFSTDKANLSVTAVVTDEDTEPGGDGDDKKTYTLTANSFTISVEQAKDILAAEQASRDSELIERAFAKAVVNETGAYVDFTSVNSDALKAVPGTYAITYVLDDDNFVTVDCTVGGKIEPGEPTDPDDEKKVKISATDIVESLDEATELELDTDEAADTLVEMARARAWRTSDNSSVAISEVENGIELKRGVYDVTFKAVLWEYGADGEKTEVDSASVTIKATINDTKVDPNPDPVDPSDPDFVNVEAFANNFVVSVSEVKEFSLDDGAKALDKLIELGKVSARTVVEHSPVDIVSADSTIKAVKGTYEVTFTTDEVDGKSVDVTSNVRVTDEGTSGGGDKDDGVDDDSNKNGEKILANNFALSKAETDAIASGTILSDSHIERAYAAEALNEGQKELIRLSNAYAYRTSDGYELDITQVDFDYTGVLGDSTVTFGTEKGTTVQVVATVTNGSAENAKNAERIVANDIEYTFEEAVDLLAKANDEIATQLKDDAEAQAYSTVDGAEVDVVQATWNIEAKGGVYDITFETEKGTSVTVKATVGDEPAKASWLGNTGDVFWKLAIFVAIVALLVGTFVVASRLKATGNHTK